MLKTIEQVEERLNNRKCRSAWDKGVNAYALELLDNLAAALAWQQLEQIPGGLARRASKGVISSLAPLILNNIF